MKVLYLSARFPWPPHRGDRLTGYNLIRALSQRHQVVLTSFVDGSESREGISEIAKLCPRILPVHLPRYRSWAQAWMGILHNDPSQVSYYRSTAMRQRVRSVLAQEKPDVVFVQLFRMAEYVRGLDHPCKVLFLADSLALSLGRSLPFQPWYSRQAVEWERRRVAAYEPSVTRDFRESWVLSDVDRADLESRGCTNVQVVPHGVDETLFALPLHARTKPCVTFLGNLSVPHNVDAAIYLVREVWPLIRRARPDATLALVGADPLPSVHALGDAPGVTVTGPVPSLVPVWERSGLLLAPLRFSTGIQNKVLEAMAAGVPVVTTPQAAEAIHALDGVHLRVGDSTEALAKAALATLAEGEGSMQRVAAARELVRAHFSWQTLIDRLELLVGETPESRNTPAPMQVPDALENVR